MALIVSGKEGQGDACKSCCCHYGSEATSFTHSRSRELESRWKWSVSWTCLGCVCKPRPHLTWIWTGMSPLWKKLLTGFLFLSLSICPYTLPQRRRRRIQRSSLTMCAAWWQSKIWVLLAVSGLYFFLIVRYVLCINKCLDIYVWIPFVAC